MGLARLHAAKWHVDPHKVGVLGFSVVGHTFGLRHTTGPITESPDLVEKWLRTIGVLPR